MLAVFVVHLAGGIVIALGPGELLLSLFPAVPHIARDLVALVFGIGMVAVAAAVWRRRARLARKEVPDPNPKRKSSLMLGAGIIVVELPTAFPYFAAIAAILGSGGAVAGQVVVLVLYNVCFVLPLLAILATLLFGGQKADGILELGRGFLEQRWPIMLLGLLLVGGAVASTLGMVGLASS